MKIIDIGAGTRPIPNCDVYTDLCDRETEDRKAFKGKLNKGFYGEDVKWVICDVEDMPHKKKQFDFSYCRSVIEHTNNPHKACEEIMRISKAGYITTPVANFERKRPNPAHNWYVWTDDGKTLRFRHKSLGYPTPPPREQFSELLMEFFWKDKFYYVVEYKNGKVKDNRNNKD